MINVNELRLGNWLSGQNDPPMRVASISNGTIELRFNGVGRDYGDWAYDDDLKPILLTPEILQKCGFEFNESMKHFIHKKDIAGIFITNGLRVRGEDRLKIDVFTDGYFVETYYSGIEIKSVHQLQNLYFALTNEELEINL